MTGENKKMRKEIAIIITSLLMANPLAHGRELSRADFVEDMNILFLKGEYDRLIKNTGSDLGRYKLGRRDKKEILYLRGLSCLKLEDFEKARESFCDILNMWGDELRQGAYIGIADSYFQEKNFDKAIEVYENALIAYPRNERISSIYYNLGLSYKEKKDFDKANSYFRKLKEGYEESFEADKLGYISDETEAPRFYIIQLGAFNGLQNAKKLVRKLTRKKYDSYIQKAKQDGSVLYKVRGGKFSNEYHAKKLLRDLRRDGFQAKIIVE